MIGPGNVAAHDPTAGVRQDDVADHSPTRSSECERALALFARYLRHDVARHRRDDGGDHQRDDHAGDEARTHHVVVDAKAQKGHDGKVTGEEVRDRNQVGLEHLQAPETEEQTR